MMNEDVTKAVPAVVGQAESVLRFSVWGRWEHIFTMWQRMKINAIKESYK